MLKNTPRRAGYKLVLDICMPKSDYWWFDFWMIVLQPTVGYAQAKQKSQDAPKILFEQPSSLYASSRLKFHKQSSREKRTYVSSYP
jgi:hypothetical protein